MAETHVIHALRQKRAQVSGELIKAKRLVSKLQGDLVHIDAVMRVFDPTIKPRQIKPSGSANPLPCSSGASSAVR